MLNSICLPLAGITLAWFARELLRLDIVTVLVLLALMLSHVLSPVAAWSGFRDSLVLLIAGVFVVSDTAAVFFTCPLYGP